MIVWTDWSPDDLPNNMISSSGDEDFVHVMRHSYEGAKYILNDHNKDARMPYFCESTSGLAVSSDGIR